MKTFTVEVFALSNDDVMTGTAYTVLATSEADAVEKISLITGHDVEFDERDGDVACYDGEWVFFIVQPGVSQDVAAWVN